MNNFEKEIDFLKQIGADKLPHSGKTLLDHLIGTSQILKNYGRSISEQKAGLFHSIYGTEYYKNSIKLNIDRQQIKDLIGNETEEIVYIFCTLRNRISSILDGNVEEKYIKILQWLEYANIKEQNPYSSQLKFFEEKIMNKNPQLNLLSIFPSPLAVVNFGEMSRELNKNLVNDIDNEMSEVETHKRSFGDNDCSWQSKFGLEVRYNSFRVLRKLVGSTISSLLDMTHFKKELKENVIVNNFWSVVVFKEGGWSHPHIHAEHNSFWTGVYYPKSIGSDTMNLDDFDCDSYVKLYNQGKKSSSSLILIDPANVAKRLTLSKKYDKNFYFGGSYSIQPREGILLLFPATLEHYVVPVVPFQEKRYSISFMTHLKPKFTKRNDSYYEPTEK